MVELLRFLEAHGFTNYIVSGGGRDFIRQIAGEIYGIPSERVVGSSTSIAFREQGDGGDLLRQYFPRGTDLSAYSQAQLDQVSLRLNQRPRKTLGFQTPASRLHASVASTT